MTTALAIVATVVAVYAGVLLALWRLQERIVFQPPANPVSPDEATGQLRYTSPDGIDLVAHFVEPAGEPKAIVLAFHGNAMISRWMIPWARELSRRCNVVVILPEYRGYDGLAGIPTYHGAALDAQAALDATMRHFGVLASDIVYYGHSLGTAVATEVASSAPPRALVLESPFSSAQAMARRWRVFGLNFFWNRISRVHYDTTRRVQGIPSPVHVAHGERDVIIPAHMGQTVHAAALTPGGLLLVVEAGHNDVAPVGGDAYWRWLEQAVLGGGQ